MLKIYLARHGQDQDNSAGILNGHRNSPLTAIGIEQATTLAEKIKKSNLNFDAIYSSPLTRCKQTAEIIANGLGTTKVQILEKLIERDFGEMTGKLISEIPALCSPHILKTNTITYFLSAPGAESFPNMINRATVLLNSLKIKHHDASMLLVTHGDFGKMLYTAYYQLNWKDVLKQFHFGNGDLILLSPDSPAKSAHVFELKQYNL